MRALASGMWPLLALAALQAPAGAFEWTIPASFHALSVRSPSSEHDFQGVQVPVIWLGGPIGPLAVHFAGGYAYQRELNLGHDLSFATLQADVDFELPLEILVPYVGVEAMGWYPVIPPAYINGIPVMVSPHAGLRFSLDQLIAFDVFAFGVPPGTQNVWNLKNERGELYSGTTWGAGGRLHLNL